MVWVLEIYGAFFGSRLYGTLQEEKPPLDPLGGFVDDVE
jgi:hypothetical protein